MAEQEYQQVGRLAPQDRPGMATWIVATIAARNALTTLNDDAGTPITDADVGRVARVGNASPYRYFELLSVDPMSWAEFGAKGEPGQDGADGADGQDGTDGTNGTDGADGQPGRDGTNGTDGQDGADGADAAFTEDAPQDGGIYGRKDGAWAQVPAASGGGGGAIANFKNAIHGLEIKRTLDGRKNFIGYQVSPGGVVVGGKALDFSEPVTVATTATSRKQAYLNYLFAHLDDSGNPTITTVNVAEPNSAPKLDTSNGYWTVKGQTGRLIGAFFENGLLTNSEDGLTSQYMADDGWVDFLFPIDIGASFDANSTDKTPHEESFTWYGMQSYFTGYTDAFDQLEVQVKFDDANGDVTNGDYIVIGGVRVDASKSYSNPIKVSVSSIYIPILASGSPTNVSVLVKGYHFGR